MNDYSRCFRHSTRMEDNLASTGNNSCTAFSPNTNKLTRSSCLNRGYQSGWDSAPKVLSLGVKERPLRAHVHRDATLVRDWSCRRPLWIPVFILGLLFSQYAFGQPLNK